MKRLSIIIAIILIICTSCGSSKINIQYYSLPGFVSMGSATEIRTEQNPFREHEISVFSKADLMGSTKRIEFDGIEYEGTYSDSRYMFYNNYLSDFYEFEHGEFSINENNGKLDTILVYNTEEGDESFEQCKEKAITLASEYINLEEYKVRVEEREWMYTFQFEKTIGGCKAASQVIVSVSTSGEIISFIAESTDEMEAFLSSEKLDSYEEKVRKLTSDEAKAGLDEKIMEVDPNCDEYNVIDTRVVFLRNGDIGVLYKVELLEKEKQENGNTRITGNGAYILLTL